MQENDNHAGRGVSWIAAVAAFFAVGSVAHGQEAVQTGQAESGRLEEIIVTAQKRVEKLQEVPISAQVVLGQTLADENYNSLEELSHTIPGLHVEASQFANEIFIRGVGSGNNPSFDQSVNTFVDDIYHGRSRQSEATFLDLERIEVLKGPQSTFFGNNAIAGALNIVTKKPGDSFDASGRLLYGQFGQYAVEGAIGGPISDTLGARLALTRNGDDKGWIDDVSTGQEIPRVNNEAARLTLTFNPSQDLDATFKAEGSQHRVAGSSGDVPVQYANCPPRAPITPGFSDQGICAQALAAGAPIGLDQNNTATIPGLGSSLSTFEDALTVNYRQWDQTFTSVTGFNSYHFNAHDGTGLDGGANLDDTFEYPEFYHQFSQEFRIASPTGGRFEYLAGAYFQTDELTWDLDAHFNFLTPIIDAIPPFAALIPYLPYAAKDDFSQGEHIYSVFGSLGWNITDALRLNAGLRASRVNKHSIDSVNFGTGTQMFGGDTPLPPALQPLAGEIIGYTPGTSPTASRSDQALMPSANLQYKFNPQAMLYLSYSRGFKAGGFDGQNLLNPTLNIGYKPEYVNAYELGLKSTWLEDRVLLNVDVFRSDYSDLQVEGYVYNPQDNLNVLEVNNAGKSRSQGVELETEWAVTKDFRLGANVTYLDSYYLSYPNGPAQTLQNFCEGDYVLPYCSVYPKPVPNFANLSGQATNFSPRWSGSVTATYGLMLPGAFKLSTQVSPFFTSSYNEQDPYDPGTAGYVRLDARFTLESPDRRWAIDLIGKNLTDRNILTGLPNTPIITKEQPRNVALQLRFHL